MSFIQEEKPALQAEPYVPFKDLWWLECPPPANLSDIAQLDGNFSRDESKFFKNNNISKKTSNFRIVEANINSLKGKKDELKVMLERDNPDCVILVETKLDESYSNSEFFDLNKWNVVVRKDRNKYGGGIIMAVLRKYVVSPVEIKYNDEKEDPELY